MAAHIGRLVRSFSYPQQSLVRSPECVLRYVPVVTHLQVRGLPSAKHYDPKFRKQRKQKIMKINLPEYQKLFKESRLPPDEKQKKLKEQKQLPPRVFQERPINISCTGQVFEPFVPPEGDGKSSVISTEGAKQRYTELGKKGKSFLELRKVRQFEDDFDIKEFAQMAQDIVTEAQACLEDVKKNENRFHELVTEKAFVEMVYGLTNKTLRWKFVQSIEPPRVTQVRTMEILGKENLYAQVTVRLHTKQILAVYDRFGRLMYGSPTVPKDCLEYVVFEKHIANEYGQWRIHAKIIPDWMPPREPLHKTYVKPKFEPLPDLEKEGETTGDKSQEGDSSNVATA